MPNFSETLSQEDIDDLIASIPTLSDAEKLEVLSVLDELEARVTAQRCRNDLIEFCKAIDPDYLVATHHKMLANLLVDIAEDRKDRIAVSVPPRHGKSHLISTLFPAWFLGKYPNKKVLMVSNTTDLAVDFGRKVRNIIGSDAYKSIFPNVTLAQDSKSAGRWSTNFGGEYFACLREHVTVTTKDGVKAVVDVQVGDYLRSDTGWVEVLAKMHTSHTATVKLGGIECSTNHPVWVHGRGWVEAGQVKAGEYLHVENISDRLKAQLTRRLHGYLEYPYVQAVVQHGAALHQSAQRKVASLRRAWYHCVRALDDVRQLLVGYGAPTLRHTHSRADRQQWPVQHGKLPLGDASRAVEQQALYCDGLYWVSHEALGSVVSRVERGQGDGAGASVWTRDDLRASPDAPKTEESELRQEGATTRGGWLRRIGARIPTGSCQSDKPGQPHSRVKGYLSCAIQGARYLQRVLLGVQRVDSVEIVEHNATSFVNFRVSGDNSFYANGVLTHNCGVGSAIAGRGADLLLVDDPHDEQDILSGNYDALDKAYQWFTFGARTRLMSGGRVAIVHTRWHMKDLIGRLVKDGQNNPKADQYEVFEFPAILPSGRALWPEKFDAEALERTKASMPAFQWNAQYQQSPTAEEAALIKREWWRPWTKDRPPTCDYIIMTLDAAAEKHNRADYTALVTFGVFYDDALTDGAAHIILLNAIKVRVEFPELKDLALREYKDWEPDSFIVEKKSAGTQLYQELRRIGVPVQEFTPGRNTGDKVARVNAVADILRSGMVWYPEGRRWAEDVIEECVAFPFGENDDLVDCVSMALSRFRQGGFIALPSDHTDNDFMPARKAAYY